MDFEEEMEYKIVDKYYTNREEEMKLLYKIRKTCFQVEYMNLNTLLLPFSLFNSTFGLKKGLIFGFANYTFLEF